MAEGIFYEEDGNKIIDAITYMMEHKNVPRIDVLLNSNEDGSKRVAKVFWVDTVLCIDIEGLK